MTRDDVLRLAREAGFEVHDRKQQARVGLDELLGIDSTAKLERFAALVAAAEREACAKLAQDCSDAVAPCDDSGPSIVDAIRARGAV
jgi:hypothetical protein